MSYVERSILGRGEQTPATLRAAIVDRGQRIDVSFRWPDGMYHEPPAGIESIIIEECARYPDHLVNADGVTCQLNEETAGWQSEYARDRNNPAGIGAEDQNPDLAYRFATPRDALRAHVAHLLDYAVGRGPWTADDPRAASMPAGWFGNCRTWADLQSKWATSGNYAADIDAIWARLAQLGQQTGGTMATPAVPTQEDIGYPVLVVWAADVGPKRSLASLRWYVEHKTEGRETGDIPTLTSGEPPVASAHAWIGRSGKLIFMVALDVTAWTPANDAVAKASINVEHEGFENEAMTEDQYRASAAFHRWCQRQGAPIPIVYVAKEDLPGICGHRDVKNPEWPAPGNCGEWGGHDCHQDPGDLFDYSKLIGLINQAPAAAPNPPDDDYRWFSETGHGIGHGFRAYWEGNGGLFIFGYPLTEELIDPATGLTVQYFERAVFEFHPENQDPYRVLLRRLGAAALDARAA